MARKLRRSKDYEIVLNIKNEHFIAPPRASQRHWVLNRAVAEWAVDLEHLHTQARHFVAGREAPPKADRRHGELADQVIMEDWQIPLMHAMAEIVGDSHGHVLEIGFGRGIAADFLQQAGISSHTIVECNDSIVARFERWRAAYPGRDIRLLHGRWQELTDAFEIYDGILFHAYPLDEEEFIDEVVKTTTFAQHFFPHAAAHLAPGGMFTYLTNEADSLSRAHQRLLFEHFEGFCVSKIGPLDVPEDTGDTLWSDSMVVIKAVKSTRPVHGGTAP